MRTNDAPHTIQSSEILDHHTHIPHDKLREGTTQVATQGDGHTAVVILVNPPI